MISSMVEENLEKYYDEIDKKLNGWLRGMEINPTQTFLKLMRGLSNTFDFFEADLYDEIQNED